MLFPIDDAREFRINRARQINEVLSASSIVDENLLKAILRNGFASFSKPTLFTAKWMQGRKKKSREIWEAMINTFEKKIWQMLLLGFIFEKRDVLELLCRRRWIAKVFHCVAFKSFFLSLCSEHCQVSRALERKQTNMKRAEDVFVKRYSECDWLQRDVCEVKTL